MGTKLSQQTQNKLKLKNKSELRGKKERKITYIQVSPR